MSADNLTSRRRIKRPVNHKPSANGTILVPSEVLDNFIGLFNDIGLDTAMLDGKSRVPQRSRKSPAHLYPRHAEIGELLTAWHQNPKYLDQVGNPLPVKRTGSCPSFADLSNKIWPTLEPRLLLRHLEQIGAVTIDVRNRIHVQMRTIPVYLDRSLAVEYTLDTLNGFIRTLRHNIKCAPLNSDQLFHRVASNAKFDPREIPALKVRIKRYGQNFLESCDNWMTRTSASRKKPSRGKRKKAQVSVGVYLAVDG